jgi:multiple sugar transport system permease protein
MSASSLSRPRSGRAAPGSALSAPRLWRPRVQRRGLVGRTLLGLFLAIAGVIMFLPVVWVVLQSFEDTKDQTSLPPVWFPSHLTLSSYRALFSAAPFGINILNSVVITAAVVIGSAIVSVLAAYAFARLEFRGREVLFTLFLAALTLPSQVSAVPEFVVVKYLHLLNTQLSLIIPALIQVVGIFLLRQHFRTIPRDLDDAARIDGAGHLKIIRHVMVPLSWPAISAVMIITGQYIWNDFFWPNLFINNTNRMPAPLALYNLESVAGGGPLGAIFAGLSVLCVPCVIGFIFLQRRLMEGIGYRGISR